MIRSRWDQRIQRADELAAAHPFAAEILQFYRRVAIVQKCLYSEFEGIGAPEAAAPSLRERSLDFSLLLPKFPEFLEEMVPFATQPLVEAVQRLKASGETRRREILTEHWHRPDSASMEPESVLVHIFLQPYAEYLAEQRGEIRQDARPAICPVCSSKPVVGALRPEGDGGKRFLICSLCATEWPFGRLLCASCGEEDPHKLAVYTAEQFPHVRVEACDSCRRYIKTVDLTKNGHAVPLVDELGTIPLNLWAEGHQYTKLQPNLLGI